MKLSETKERTATIEMTSGQILACLMLVRVAIETFRKNKDEEGAVFARDVAMKMFKAFPRDEPGFYQDMMVKIFQEIMESSPIWNRIVDDHADKEREQEPDHQ